MTMRLKKTSIIFSAALGAAAVGLLGATWIYRVELIWIPRYWSEVQKFRSLRDRYPRCVLEKTGPEGLDALELAASRLIRLQRPGFTGGRGFVFKPLRTHEGKTAWAASFFELAVPFDNASEENEPITHFFCDCIEQNFLVLDSRGRLLDGPFKLLVHTDSHGEPEPYQIDTLPEENCDLLRVPVLTHCFQCSRITEWDEFSVDRAGLVHRGLSSRDALTAPTCSQREERDLAIDRDRFLRWLESDQRGDLYRALNLLERRVDEFLPLARPLLHHADPRLRARALAVLGRDPRLKADAIALLKDPAPRVRFAAIHAASGCQGWEEAVLALIDDPDYLVVLAADRELVSSRRAAFSEEAVLRLLEKRDPSAAFQSYCRFATVRVAGAIIERLEENAWQGQHNLTAELDAHFGPAALRPFVKRMISLYREHELRGSLDVNLASSLARLDDAEGDAALLATLSRHGFDDETFSNAVLGAWAGRDTPPENRSVVLFLRRLLECVGPKNAAPQGDCHIKAALLLFRYDPQSSLDSLLPRLKGEAGLLDKWVDDAEHLSEAALAVLQRLAVEDPQKYEEKVNGALKRWWLRELDPPKNCFLYGEPEPSHRQAEE